MGAGPEIDALALITNDLEAQERRRRRHFAPALVLMALGLGAFLGYAGIRGDLWQQPPWQVGTQLVLWPLALVGLPAIGLGLVFPRPRTRKIIGVATLALVGVATFGQVQPDAKLTLGMCFYSMLALGAALSALGWVSGAFVAQRRSRARVWLAAGLALLALGALNWHCPSQSLSHLLIDHLGAAVLLCGIVVFLSRAAQSSRSA